MHLNFIARAAETPLPLHLYPLDQRVKIGQMVSWYLTAAGSEPLEYQWKLNGKAIPGANANVLRIVSAKESDQGAYTCQIKNHAGLTETETVALAVESAGTLNTAQKIQVNKAPSNATAQNRVPAQP
jgi:hypothetical protein